MGRLTGVTEESGATALTYDEQGRITADAKTIQTQSYTVGYAYDANGKVTTIALPSGRTVSYARAADGLVTGITSQATPTSSTDTLASGVAYLPFGPLQGLTYGNGLTLTRTYDQNYWLSQIQVTGTAVTKLDLSFGRNADGQLISVTDNASTGRGAGFGYTDAGRLNAATGPWGADAFTYDAAGNRTDKARGVGGAVAHETPILASSSNRVTQVQDGSGAVLRTLTWNAGGDLAQDADASGATFVYGYNARKRLVSAGASGAATGTYGYDYLGHRVWRTVVDGSTTIQTHYVFDEAGHLLAEHDGATGAVRREYVWLDDMPVAMIDSTGASPAIYALHAGQLDEPVTMTDAGGNTVWDGFLEPFGQAQVFGAPSVDLRLPGQFAEAESGLFQNWNRNYDPSLGRYVEADPLGLAAGQNVYGYVDGDPLGLKDPRGTCIDLWAGCIVERVVARGLISGGLDLASQLSANHGNWACVDWRQVGVSALAGASVAVGLEGFALLAEDLAEGFVVGAVEGRAPVAWNNGWRTADGRFASPLGAGRAGQSAESAAWDAVEAKPGWSVDRGPVAVRNASGQLRYYDGVAHSPAGRVIGLEIKSGGGARTAAQRTFDATLNSSRSNTAIGVGQSVGIVVDRALFIRIP